MPKNPNKKLDIKLSFSDWMTVLRAMYHAKRAPIPSTPEGVKWQASEWAMTCAEFEILRKKLEKEIVGS